MSDIELTTNPNSNSLAMNDNSVKLLSPAGAASYKRRRVYDKVNSRIRTCDHVINTAVNSVRFSNDGKNIVTAGEDLNIVIWDVASGKQINEISICDGSEDSRGITFACFSPDGRTIACCRDDIALVLSVDDSNAEGAKKFEHKNDVTCISVSPDGRFLATGCKDKFARIYDLEMEPDLEVQSDEGTVWKSSQFGNGVSCISFSFDGKTLAVGCDDATLRNFDFQRDVDPVEKWKKTLYSWITCVSFSPMGNIMAAGTDCYVHFLDVVSGKDVLDCLVHDSRVTSSCFSPDGRCIVTGCSSGSCRFYDVASGIQIHEIHHRDTVTSVSFFPSFFPDKNDVLMNSPLRVATSCDDSVARIYDVGVDPESTWVYPHKDFIQSLCFSPDERTIATGCDDCFVRIFDVDNGEELKSIKLETIVTTVCFSPDGTMIAAACEDDFIHIFNVDSCKLINKFENNEKRSTISFSPDSKNVATIYNKFCIIFNVSSGKEILKLEHEHYVTTACFSPDGQHIATGSYISHNDDACYARVFFHAFVPEQTSKKKKPTSFKPILKLPHQDTVTSINFSSDGKWLVTGCEDQYARIFDAEIPTTSEKIRKAIKRFEHGDTVNSVRFSSDGRSIYTNCDDPYARVFIIEGMDKDDEEDIEVEDDEQNDDDEENENEEGEKLEDDDEENIDEGSENTMYAFATSRFAVSSRHSIAYTDGNSLYVMPCPHDFAADASLPVFSDFALLWSRCNGKLVEAGGISDSHVVLSEFFAPNGGGLVAIASKWQDYDFPDALDTLVRLFDGDQPVVNASLILSKLLQVNDPDKDMPNAVAIKALLGNISRNPIVAARDNDLTQQLARVLTEFPSIASVVGEFWCGEDIKFELAPSHSIVMDESDPVTSIESVRMSVSFSESVRMYVAGSDSVNVPVFKSHFEKRPQVSGLALEYEHLILPLPNASAHRDGSDHKQTLMEALVETGNIDVFGSVPVRAIVQYKWETYGFVSWLKQFFRYCFGLALLVALSILTWQFWEPRRENHDGPQRENQDALFAAMVVLSILYSIEILYFASREFRQFMHGIQGDGGLFERLKKSDQLDDPWNWLDLLHIIFGICSCILVWARSEKSLPVLAVTSFLRWWGILFYLQVRILRVLRL
jgi:WD40 repeat protein